MKIDQQRLVSLLLTCMLTFSLIGCHTEAIEIAKKSGVIHVQCAQPLEVFLINNSKETKIEDEAFGKALIDAIHERMVIESACNCSPQYTVRIAQYEFGLHTHGISVFVRKKQAPNEKTHIGTVEREESEMEALFAFLEEGRHPEA